MYLFILIVILLALGLFFTIINFQYTTTITLLFYTFKIPGVLLLYLGILIGAIITIPFIYSYSRKYAHNVLNKSIKQETKRLKHEEKKLKKNSSKTPAKDTKLPSNSKKINDSKID